jgi:CHAD domain-containing protein
MDITHAGRDHTEVEWQFDADDLNAVRRRLAARRARGGAAIGRFTARAQIDTYLDTDDWRFYRAGYALRVRQAGPKREATLKSLAAGAASERRRREVSEDLGEEPGDVLEAVRRAPGPVGERVRAVAGARPLRPLFDIRTRRQSAPLRLKGAAVGEVALDETTAGPGPSAARLLRVEVEVDAARAEALRPFIERLSRACRLRPAAASKFETGLAAVEARPPQPADSGIPWEARAGQPAGELARLALRRRLAELLACEPGTRLGEEADCLHDMRVANRRLRAALALFRRHLPGSMERFRDEWRWLAAALGEARDLDVQIASLRAWMAEVEPADRAGLQSVEALLLEQRAAARRRMLDALDSERYARLVSDFGAALEEKGPGQPASARARVGRIMPDQIERRYRRVLRLGDSLEPDSPAPAYHALRIACKRLRYALELVTDLYGKPARTMLKRLMAAQDLLGQYQDSQVATARLRNLSLRPDLPAAAAFALGEIAQRHAQRGSELRSQIPAVTADLKGGAWRRLRRALRKGR